MRDPDWSIEEKIARLETILAEFPDNQEIIERHTIECIILACCEIAIDNFDGTINALKRALKFNPHDETVISMLIQNYNDEAVRLFNEVRADKTRYKELYQQAIGLLKEAIKLRPEDHVVHNNIKEIEADRLNNEAIELCNQVANDCSPEDTKNKLLEAYEKLNEALELVPNDPIIKANLDRVIETIVENDIEPLRKLGERDFTVTKHEASELFGSIPNIEAEGLSPEEKLVAFTYWVLDEYAWLLNPSVVFKIKQLHFQLEEAILADDQKRIEAICDELDRETDLILSNPDGTIPLIQQLIRSHQMINDIDRVNPDEARQLYSEFEHVIDIIRQNIYNYLNDMMRFEDHLFAVWDSIQDPTNSIEEIPLVPNTRYQNHKIILRIKRFISKIKSFLRKKT